MKPLTVFSLAAFALQGCISDPSGGRGVTFMSPQDEARLGRDEHPKVIAEFGGEYDHPELKTYVASVGNLLARTSEMPDLPFTFTILNNDRINAFALPGGFVYITRGLLALADNEAELASVLGHEIGHVTSRHTAERVTAAQTVGILGVIAGIAGAAIGGQAAGELASSAVGAAGQVGIASYSRDQELEADQLGLRYMARAGYDVEASPVFFRKMQANDLLEARLEGRKPNGGGLLATHPRTAERIREAGRIAGAISVANPMVERELYLRKIDGMLFGDDPKQGVIKGQRFLHPELGFRFAVPQGFKLANATKRVAAQGPSGAVMIFDGTARPAGSMQSYIRDHWAPRTQLTRLEPTRVNGLEGATALARLQTREGPVSARLVAIAFSPRQIYRFLFVAPVRNAAALEDEFFSIATSFGPISTAEIAEARPQRIDLYTVRPGDTVESLASRMRVDQAPVERFLVLNGLEAGAQLRPGTRLKLVGD
jgi:predicted Zn-dependent protease